MNQFINKLNLFHVEVYQNEISQRLLTVLFSKQGGNLVARNEMTATQVIEKKLFSRLQNLIDESADLRLTGMK